jgi:hypothetical protein
LSRQLFNDFPAVFFDRDVFISSSITQYKGEFVAVTGVVNKYKNKYNNKEVLQLMVSLPSQVKGSKLPLLENSPTNEEPPPAEPAPTTDADKGETTSSLTN